jgi:hypothetical protein
MMMTTRRRKWKTMIMLNVRRGKRAVSRHPLHFTVNRRTVSYRQSHLRVNRTPQ